MPGFTDWFYRDDGSWSTDLGKEVWLAGCADAIDGPNIIYDFQ
jgi:hypothetical protein